MARRVIFQAGGGSPLRISVAGVDAASAQFDTLIFDGNQPPLRLWMLGYVTTFPLVAGNSFNINVASGPSIPTPAGTTPIFFCMKRQTNQGAAGGDTNNNMLPIRSPAANAGGMGGAVVGSGAGSDNVFIGLNFNRDNASGGFYNGAADPGIVNYAIMRNYQ